MQLAIGEKIMRLRKQHGLTQEELASRCDLSKGFISQLERDLTSPSIATLKDILDSLGTTLHDFFSEQSDEKIVFRPDEVFENVDEAQGTVIRWLIPNAQKNGMEPILVVIQPGHATVLDDPHEGEEFGLVLSGSIIIALGDQRHKARKDCAFYFHPTAPHQLINSGKKPASVVWVSTPPSF